MSTPKPLVFVDLDNNLFQTARKMQETPKHLASLDKFGQPSGYMTDKQHQLVQWLLATTDLVPVTARSREVYSRVVLDFSYGAICSHGGIILSPNNELDDPWHTQMAAELEAYQSRLKQLLEVVLVTARRLKLSLRCWAIKEVDSYFYVQVKHNQMADEVLYQLLTEITTSEAELMTDLFTPINGNNLAFIPKVINKKLAVKEFIKRDSLIYGKRPVLGFGDSLSDLGFLSVTDFWGAPNKSQISQKIQKTLSI